LGGVGGSASAAIEFRLLGPVEALRDGSPLPLGGPRQRALLALLLREPGRPVSAEHLAEELWHGRAPAGAATTLRSYVSKLRTVLDAGAPLVATPGGYAIEVALEAVDSHRFERLTKEGEEALARRRAQQAGEVFREALELWRGRAFDGLADDGALRLEAERLEQLRLLALEQRIEADLALGASGDLVEEIEALVREHPYRERLWRQLMLALYRAERQADALAAYHRARALLDELGLEPSEELRALEQSILRQDVPPTVAPEQRHNLPAPLTSFVGRQVELDEIGRLLENARLVTLTGVGGAGKTRLALEAAAHAVPLRPDGVFFVDFSGLGDPSLVAAQVASALGLGDQSASTVAAHLRDADLLLVLDNCEHLRESCADLVRTLLGGCPRLQALVTSRELLGVPGEVDYPVPPLALPGADAGAERLRSSDAVRLLLARAREARPHLPDDDELLATAGRICRDLDGLPLAIELAAARAKALSLDEIATRLADRFRFLVSWRRLATARHSTLLEAMDWSYELLAEEERTVLAGLSVFSGGFTLPAVVGVCLDGDDGRAIELVARLVDASLVVADEREGEMRYRLLETVRQYAGGRLVASGEDSAAQRRHAEWYLALAEQAAPELSGEQQAQWFGVLEVEHDNLRAALDHLAEADESELLLRLTIALTRFWYVRGHLVEASARLRQSLAPGGEQTPELRRRALTAAASLALLQGDYEASTAFAEESLDVARRAGEPHHVANALSNLGAIVLAAGDHSRAEALLEEAVALARTAGDERVAAMAINNLGDLALTVGDYERAEPLFEESLALLRSRGDTANVARSLFNLGAVALELGRVDHADERLRESLTLAEQTGDKEDIAWCLEGFAGLAAAASAGKRAALLLGAAGALLDEMGADFKPFERQLHDATRDEALRLCGERGFAAAVQEGASMSLADAVAAALSVPLRA
jgi:predicted ATPase/DNA-binding SARP family transcriptional activator